MDEKCPECESSKLITHSSFTHYMPYGAAPDTVTIVYDAPMMECSSCGFLYTGEAHEKAQEEAIARYRRMFAA